MNDELDIDNLEEQHYILSTEVNTLEDTISMLDTLREEKKELMEKIEILIDSHD